MRRLAATPGGWVLSTKYLLLLAIAVLVPALPASEALGCAQPPAALVFERAGQGPSFTVERADDQVTLDCAMASGAMFGDPWPDSSRFPFPDPEVPTGMKVGFGLFGTVFVVMLGIFAVFAMKGIAQWSHNNRQPVIQRSARVVTKRTNTWGGSGDSSASTSYYATFEFDDGSREEFDVWGSTYGLMAEGDLGTLHSQGTRFHSFDRNGEGSQSDDTLP